MIAPPQCRLLFTLMDTKYGNSLSLATVAPIKASGASPYTDKQIRTYVSLDKRISKFLIKLQKGKEKYIYIFFLIDPTPIYQRQWQLPKNKR